MYYFDYCATTPVDKEVLDAYVQTTQRFFANTASLHSLGQTSHYMYEMATSEITKQLQLRSHKVVYTYNATEANNLAIFGVTKKHKTGKIISTKMEHISVYKTIQQLETQFDVVYLNIDDKGQIDLDQLKKELNKSVILVSIMWVNNVIGTIQDVSRVIELVKRYPKAKLHVDCVQGVGKVEPNFDMNDIDLITLSGHKLYGPKGVAALLYHDKIVLEKMLFGSNGQYEVKPGTLDVSLVVALATTIKKYCASINAHTAYVKTLWEYLYKLLSACDYVRCNTPQTSINYYVLNISLDNMQGETMVHALEAKQIYVSTGSACSSKQRKPERTVFAMTQDENRAHTSIRISLSHLTTLEQVDYLVESIKEIMVKKCMM